MVKAIIFDMDGTVVDSTAHDFKAWERVMKERGITFPYEDFLALLGAKGEEIVRRYLTITPEEIKAFLSKKETYFQEIASLKGLHTMPGIVDFLDKVARKQLPAALATGAGNTKLEYIFERIAIGKYFKVVLTANDIQKGKPDPEIFLKAAEKLGVSPAEAMVVEDAPNGVKAAKLAGMKCLAITSTHPRERLLAADVILDRYEEFDWKLLE